MFNSVNNNNWLPSNSFAVLSKSEAIDGEEADSPNNTQASSPDAQVDRQALNDAQKLLGSTPLAKRSRKDQFFPVDERFRATHQPMNLTRSSTHSASNTLEVNQGKSALAHRLFKKILSTVASLKVPHQPNLFLVYAHDNSTYGQAKAEVARYLIEQLSLLPVRLYSDRTPIAKPYSGLGEKRKKGGQLEDILTSQLCLLPSPLQDEVTPVDKVVVCSSEVLGRYLAWPTYPDFYQKLQQAYRKDVRERGDTHLRRVIDAFSQQDGFHHVLTEMAFLQIRAEELGDEHGIIPVGLTPDSYQSCLHHFIGATTVRIEDMSRLEQVAQGMHVHQGQHMVMLKLIGRLFAASDAVQAAMTPIWQEYSRIMGSLKSQPAEPNVLAFFDQIDGMVAKIQTVLDQQALLPRHLSLSDLRQALHQYYYHSDLSIQRISGQTVPLAHCYINLAIVESHAQQAKEKDELVKQATAVTRLPSSEQLHATNYSKLITLDHLFDAQRLRDGTTDIPQRILIQGRAGIGKTTLCKKLVFDYQHEAPWKNRFDCVLWVPLRQLKTFQCYSVEKLLSKRYFASRPSDSAKALAQAFHAYKDRTLFILDGLDEVVGELDESHLLSDFLKELLRQKHVIITSRPAGMDPRWLGQLDLELETVGFTPDNVQTYIQTLVPETNRIGIQTFINNTPVLQGLVNIPVQLDALCYSWEDVQAQIKAGQSVTMTALYQAMVDKLWHKDGVRLEKAEAGKLFTLSGMAQLSREEIEQQLMVAEYDYLSYLSFRGLEDQRIEFDWAYLKQIKDQLNRLRLEKLPLQLNQDLKQTSFLHTADAHLIEKNRAWHLLHLTIQEYFTAKFLAKHFDAYLTVEGSYKAQAEVTERGLVLALKVLQNFMAQHKYNPRYQIVWWMVAGLLEGEVLEGFFHLLGQAPQEVVKDNKHLVLIMHSLHEARARLSRSTIQRLEKQLEEGFLLLLKSKKEYEKLKLGTQQAFPEHLLLKFGKQHGEYQDLIYQILVKRQTLSDQAVAVLENALQHSDVDIQVILYYGLGAYAAKVESIQAALLKRFWEETEPEAIAALTQRLSPHADNIKAIRDAFLMRLETETKPAAIAALAQQLGRYVRYSDAIRDVLLKRLEAESRPEIIAKLASELGPHARYVDAIRDALLKRLEAETEPEVIAVLIQRLSLYADNVKAIRDALLKRLEAETELAAIAALAQQLGRYARYSEAIRDVLLKRFEAETKPEIIATLALELGPHAGYVEAIRDALLKQLEAQTEPEVIAALTHGLSLHANCTQPIREALLKQLKSETAPKVRAALAQGLDPHANRIEAIREAFLRRFEAVTVPEARAALALALSPYADDIKPIQDALLKRLEVETELEVIVAITQGLCSHANRIEAIRDALLKRLKMETEPEVIAALAKQLGLHAGHSEATQALKWFEAETESEVIAALAKELGLHAGHNETIRDTLLKRFEAETASEVIAALAKELGLHAGHSEAIRDTLLKRFEADTEPEVIAALAKELGLHAHSSGGIRDALLKRFEAETEPEVIAALAKGLGWQTRYSGGIRDVLLKRFEAETEPEVIAALAKGLGWHAHSSEAIRDTLLKRFEAETEPEVIAALAKGLGSQARYSGAIRDALLKRVKTEIEPEIIAALAKGLGSHANDIKLIRDALLKRFEMEKNSKAIAALAQGLGWYAHDIDAIRDALLKRFEAEKKPKIIAALTWALGSHADRSEAILGALLKRFKAETEPKAVAALAQGLGWHANDIEAIRVALLERFEVETEPNVKAALAQEVARHANHVNTV